MIKRVFNLFHQEFGGLNQAAMILASSSLISGFLGLLRDRLLAGTFGAGQMLDVYYASFKIPDFLYIISLSIASVTVLIPFFLERISTHQEKGQKFFDNIFSIFLLAMILLTAIVFFIIPYLSDIVAPGFSLASKNQFVILTRILLLSPFLLGLSNLLSSIVQSFNRFFVYALSPLLYNIGIIFGIVFLFPRLGMTGIVLGVVLGALLHVSIQIPTIIKLNFVPKFKLKLNFPEAWQVIKFSLPRTFGLGLNQIVLIFITAMASLFSVGSIAVFNLSLNLQSVPLAVIGVSYSVAAFPTLARLFVSNQKKKFLEQTIIALRQIIFWLVPISILVIVLRAQIVRVIFGYGKFGWRDTRLTAACLALFAISLFSQALITLFVRAFYAAGKTMRPIIVNVVSSVFTILGIFIFLGLINNPSSKSFMNAVLRVKDVPGSEMLILPLVFSLGMIFNSIFLVKIFQKDFGPVWEHIRKTFFQISLASLLMGVITYLSLNIFDKIFNIRTFIGIFLQGFISAILGAVVWYLILSFMKNEELHDIVKVFKQKFWKTPAIAPEPEELP